MRAEILAVQRQPACEHVQKQQLAIVNLRYRRRFAVPESPSRAQYPRAADVVGGSGDAGIAKLESAFLNCLPTSVRGDVMDETLPGEEAIRVPR